MRAVLTLLLSLFLLTAVAQGRRLPHFSFAPNSIQFADANRGYNDKNQYTDTIQDERILRALWQIMEKNSELIIEIVGHTAINEDTLLGQQRADTIRNYLLGQGVSSERVSALNRGYSEPIISEAVIESLPTAIEVEAAHQKNRRAEVKVVAVKEEE